MLCWCLWQYATSGIAQADEQLPQCCTLQVQLIGTCIDLCHVPFVARCMQKHPTPLPLHHAPASCPVHLLLGITAPLDCGVVRPIPPTTCLTAHGRPQEGTQGAESGVQLCTGIGKPKPANLLTTQRRGRLWRHMLARSLPACLRSPGSICAAASMLQPTTGLRALLAARSPAASSNCMCRTVYSLCCNSWPVLTLDLDPL